MAGIVNLKQAGTRIVLGILVYIRYMLFIEPAEREHGGRALRENLHAKPKESIRSNEARESKNDAQIIRKGRQKAGKWSRKGCKLE